MNRSYPPSFAPSSAVVGPTSQQPQLPVKGPAATGGYDWSLVTPVLVAPWIHYFLVPICLELSRELFDYWRVYG